MPGETRHSKRHRPPATYLVASDHKVQDHLEGTIRLQRGQLCREQEAGRGDQLWVKVLDNGSVVKVRRQALEELRSDLAALLEPVRDLEKRLKLLSKQHRLQRLLELPLGSEVSVIWNQSGELAEAELRYRGPLARGTSAVFFGVQLKGWAAGRGTCNGSHKGRQLFCCDEACGLFLPVSDLVLSRRDLRPHPSQSPASPEHVLPLAPAVPAERGALVPLSKVTRDTHRPAKPAPPPSPPRRPPLIQPSMLISARRALQPPKPLPKPRASSAPITERWVEPGGFLEVGSLVEVNEPALFGVIRWIGQIPGDPEPVAGIELDQEMPAATDGTFLGERLFRCLPHKALFVKLRNCRRDSRFPLPEEPLNQVERCNSIAFASWSSKRVEENSPPPASGLDALLLYQGRKKGIQGHLNSCYLDASLFSMFSCSSSFDWLLFCPAASQSSKDAQDLLRCEIVNPLRRCGYVCASKTMPLRKLLKAETADPGFTSEEKDPEELLNQLFLLLKAEPLLKIRSVSQEQECFIYQVFPPSSPQAPALPGSATPPPHQTPPPTPPFPAAGAGLKQVASVQTLLESSFVHSGLKLTEAPSCLPLLMPRFGKEFKMFDAILPSLTLDLTDLLDQSAH